MRTPVADLFTCRRAHLQPARPPTSVPADTPMTPSAAYSLRASTSSGRSASASFQMRERLVVRLARVGGAAGAGVRASQHDVADR